MLSAQIELTCKPRGALLPQSVATGSDAGEAGEDAAAVAVALAAAEAARRKLEAGVISVEEYGEVCS